MTRLPFLTEFPLTVFATAGRRLQAAIHHASALVNRRSLSDYSVLLEDLLPGAFLAPIDPTQRQRSVGHCVFWAWLAQILEANASCQKAAGLIQSWCRSCGMPVPSSDTAATARPATASASSRSQMDIATIGRAKATVRPVFPG